MTPLEILVNAGLPATSAYYDEETGRIEATFSRPLTEAEQLTFLSLVDPPKYEKVINIKTLKNDYQAALDRLADIINTPNPTQVNLNTLIAMANAIRDMAIIERKMLRVEKEIVT